MPDRDKLRSGDMDRRIRIERASYTSNHLGEQIPTWDRLVTVWAQVLPISDGERWRAAEVAAHVTTRFRIRWGSGVTVTDRIVYDGRVFDISGVKEIGRHEGQEITAAARSD